MSFSCSGTEAPEQPENSGGQASGGAGFGGSGAGGSKEPNAGATSTSGGRAGADAGGTAGVGAGGASEAGGGNAGASPAETGGAGGMDDSGLGGAGGSGGAAPGEPEPSAGCGTAASQELDEWVDGMVMVDNTSRPYAVRLPNNYDPARAYPVVMLLHGCTSGTNNLPMERHTGEDAILVRGTGSASNTCWDTSANGADLAFFDAMVAAAKERFCADSSRIFAVGYSSGSWLINQLSCIRADVVRAAGTVAGGNPARQAAACMGSMAQMFIHDLDDMENGISGSESARDRLLSQNECDTSQPAVAQEPSPCMRYQGCKPGYPVVWCATSGEGHNRQDDFAAPAIWDFFKELL